MSFIILFVSPHCFISEFFPVSAIHCQPRDSMRYTRSKHYKCCKKSETLQL